MPKREKETTVISLSGSLIISEGSVNDAYIRNFRDAVTRRARGGRRFVVVCGGGYLSREYQRAASKIAGLTSAELDWIGIHATHLNAHFVRSVFGRLADPDIVTDPTAPVRSRKSVIVGGGWKPGCSSDYDTVLLAEKFHAKTVINLSNIDYVYDRDPRRHKDAKPIREMTWEEFRRMAGSKWIPGLNLPFDPIASKAAHRLGLRVIIANGRKTANLGNILDGKKFIGTLIG